MVRETFSSNLKNLVKNSDISQRQICSLLGITTSTMQRWLTGNAWPSDTHIAHLADILNVEVYELFKSDSAEPTVRPINSAQLSKYFQALADHTELVKLMAQFPKGDKYIGFAAKVLEGGLELIAEEEEQESNHKKKA